MKRLKKKITPIVDSSYIYKLKYVREKNINIPKNIMNIVITKKNSFILTDNGDLYKNDTLYAKNCLHIYEYSSRKEKCRDICFIYKGNRVEFYHESNVRNQKDKYDKVLFGYDYLVLLKDKKVSVYKQMIVDFEERIYGTIELVFEDVDDCAIYLEPVNLANPKDDYDEEDCVDVIELTKNQEKIIVPVPCIYLAQ